MLRNALNGLRSLSAANLLAQSNCEWIVSRFQRTVRIAAGEERTDDDWNSLTWPELAGMESLKAF